MHNVFDEVFSPSSARHLLSRDQTSEETFSVPGWHLPKRSSKLGIKIARRPFQLRMYKAIVSLRTDRASVTPCVRI
jgi:hypothetical protein